MRRAETHAIDVNYWTVVLEIVSDISDGSEKIEREIQSYISSIYSFAYHRYQKLPNVQNLAKHTSVCRHKVQFLCRMSSTCSQN